MPHYHEHTRRQPVRPQGAPLSGGSGDGEGYFPPARGSYVRLAPNASAVTDITSDQLQPGDLLLSTTSEAISATIREVTDSPVSHVAVYIGNGEVIEGIGDGGVLRAHPFGTAHDRTLAQCLGLLPVFQRKRRCMASDLLQLFLKRGQVFGGQFRCGRRRRDQRFDLRIRQPLQLGRDQGRIAPVQAAKAFGQYARVRRHAQPPELRGV